MLMSLPESFNNFRLTYNMSKSHYSLAKLLKELQAAEGIIGHKRSLHVMKKGSSSSIKKCKVKKKVPKRDAKPKQQNGVAKRRNRTLLDMVRSMMSYGSLPSNFWGYALETT